MEKFDVVVIGAGLIGCSIAFELANERLKIVVLDRQEPGREASWAAAGMLSPAPESARDIPLVPLSRESLRIYPDFVHALEQESGQMIGYARRGTLQVFSGAAAEEERDTAVAFHNDLALHAEAIPLKEVHSIGLSARSRAQAAAWLPDEGTVEPRLLMAAVLAALGRRGVEVRSNCGVNRILEERKRCVGVVTNQTIAAGNVVIAAGCFSAGIVESSDGLAAPVPTRPVRGQMVALKTRGFALPYVIRSESGYVVPRKDGLVVAGSTIEEAGFEKKVTATGLRQILGSAIDLCPELADSQVVETWSGLRPGTPDALPILGPVELQGLIAATGHYRNGILLAPITARLVREWITAGATAFDAHPFSPFRFSKTAGAYQAKNTSLTQTGY